jgi:beta-xylosidase
MPKPYSKRKKETLIGSFLFIIFSVVIIVSASRFDTIRDFFSQAMGTPANIVIDGQAIMGPLNRSWRNLAQGGESYDWRMTGITDKVNALNPEYIRLDHIFSFYDIVQGSPQNLSFDFSKLDLILNDILAVGAKPYIALSYMPSAISQGDIVDAPHHWTDWQVTIQRTIEHISGTRGIEDVYYEVWNEPDLFGGWRTYGNKNYLTMYSYAALGAQTAQGQSHVKNFYLGGPGITALYRNWFHAMARHTINNNLKYDFFSWHRYDHNLDVLEKDLTQVQSWRARYPQLRGLKLHVTEWGPDSENHPAYDNTYGAAHTMAGAIVLNQLTDRAFVFEIQDGKDPNNKSHWGRWGLLTHQDFGSQPKPRYYALHLLNKIGEQKLYITGQGSWVKAIAARNARDNIDFVMANADRNYQRYEVVPITFTNISPGEYDLNLEYLDGRRESIPLVANEPRLRTEIHMTPNTVVYGELIRK